MPFMIICKKIYNVLLGILYRFVFAQENIRCTAVHNNLLTHRLRSILTINKGASWSHSRYGYNAKTVGRDQELPNEKYRSLYREGS